MWEGEGGGRVALEVSVCYIMCIRSGCELRTSTLWQTMHHKFTT